MKRKILAAILGGMLIFTAAPVINAPETVHAEDEHVYEDFLYTL